jgi:ferredoxin, 2Fe-2S
MPDMISFSVIDTNDQERLVQIPEDINLSLMEVLKASEYDILATCGGMALCATCHVQVAQGLERLNSPTDAELDMIDTLPNAKANSRLACQIRVSPTLEGMSFCLAK